MKEKVTPRWAPLKLYTTAEVMQAPHTLLEKTIEYLSGTNPRTGEIRVPPHERVALISRVTKDGNSVKNMLSIIREFIYVIDKDRLSNALAKQRDTGEGEEGDVGAVDGKVV